MEARPTRHRRGQKEWRSATRPPLVVVGIRGGGTNRGERDKARAGRPLHSDRPVMWRRIHVGGVIWRHVG
jgi:hypothetical protein